MTNRQGQPLDLLHVLPRTEQTTLDCPVQVSAQHLAYRLVAVRVPVQVAEARRRKLPATAKDKGRTPDARQSALCDWVILLTKVPAKRASVTDLLVLARAVANRTALQTLEIQRTGG